MRPSLYLSLKCPVLTLMAQTPPHKPGQCILLAQNRVKVYMDGCHPKHVENYPRKPNANFALNKDIADIDEQVSSDTVHIGTFSKYQP
jgi:hypothetical protein